MSATWRCGSFRLDVARPLVMGILNVTPDSFSDGGAYADPQAAVSAGLRMVADGADVVDVGGESTRPGAAPVTAQEEAARVIPVIHALAAQGACVSADTRHAAVASAALAAGASILNDISGFSDPGMVRAVVGSGAALVVMHMLGDPRTMQADPVYADVVAEVKAYLSGRVETLERAGVARDRIAIDPGIGFGKTTAHNLELLARLDELVALGLPVLVGVSRKRFIGEVTGVAEPRERVAGSVCAALSALRAGAAVVRVHDVAATVQAIAVERAIEGAESAR
jgi:dihydropteroate synthase